MKKEKLKTYAAMISKDEDIRKNSTKLYSYLLCIAGKEPDSCGRLFQQKNLVLTKIQQYTGLQPKTIKLYLYELECNNLVQFRGNEHFRKIEFLLEEETDKRVNELLKNKPELSEEQAKEIVLEKKFTKSEIRALKEKEAFSVWKKREKSDYYRIPRAESYTPIPEITLEKLNKDFEVDEMEMKVYILLCHLRDVHSEYSPNPTAQVTFESLREILGLKDNSSATNRTLKRIFYFLMGIGLIDFEIGYYYNTKGAKIECFVLKEVNYFVTDNKKELREVDNESNEIIVEVKNRMKNFS